MRTGTCALRMQADFTRHFDPMQVGNTNAQAVHTSPMSVRSLACLPVQSSAHLQEVKWALCNCGGGVNRNTMRRLRKQEDVRTHQVRRDDRELAGDVRNDAPGGLAGVRVQADLLHTGLQPPSIIEVHLRSQDTWFTTCLNSPVSWHLHLLLEVGADGAPGAPSRRRRRRAARRRPPARR